MVRFVPAQRSDPGSMQFPMLVHLCQGHGRFVLRNRIVHRDGRAEPVPVLHQHLRAKAQLARLPLGLAIEHTVRIGGAAMGRVAPLLAVKVHRRVARIIVFGRLDFGLILPVLADKALQTGPRLDQRAVGGEVLVAGPALLPRQIIDLHKEQLRGIGREHPLIVVGKHRRIKAAFVQLPVEKPKPQEIVG